MQNNPDPNVAISPPAQRAAPIAPAWHTIALRLLRGSHLSRLSPKAVQRLDRQHDCRPAPPSCGLRRWTRLPGPAPDGRHHGFRLSLWIAGAVAAQPATRDDRPLPAGLLCALSSIPLTIIFSPLFSRRTLLSLPPPYCSESSQCHPPYARTLPRRSP